MRVEHADLAGIPHAHLKGLVVHTTATLLDHLHDPAPAARLHGLFVLGIAEQLAEFDAGETDPEAQHLYETAVSRLCRDVLQVSNPIPSVWEDTTP